MLCLKTCIYIYRCKYLNTLLVEIGIPLGKLDLGQRLVSCHNLQAFPRTRVMEVPCKDWLWDLHFVISSQPFIFLRYHRRGGYDVENEEKVKLGMTNSHWEGPVLKVMVHFLPWAAERGQGTGGSWVGFSECWIPLPGVAGVRLLLGSQFPCQIVFRDLVRHLQLDFKVAVPLAPFRMFFAFPKIGPSFQCLPLVLQEPSEDGYLWDCGSLQVLQKGKTSQAAMKTSSFPVATLTGPPVIALKKYQSL